MGGEVALALTAAAAAGFGAYATRARSSTIFGPSIYRGSRARRAIALTFDDGPSPSTPALLDILAEHDVQATFFQCGMHVRRLPDIARDVVDAGHEVGNHTDTHARLWLRSREFIECEIAQAQHAIENAAGVRPSLFRAPYGVRWWGLSESQARHDLMGVMWTALARDWRLPADAIAARLLDAAENGAIFCLHDGRERAAAPDISNTLRAVRTLIPHLLDRGYQLCTVSELLRSD